MSSKMKANHTNELSAGEAKRKSYRSNDCIIEHIVSLSGLETEKVYIKRGFLGRGGFANCFITQLVGSKKLIATKVVDKINLKSSRTKFRLISEIKTHKTFSHPNIVEFLHYFEDLNNVYIMLELCENESLNELLKDRGTLTYPEVQSFLYGICNGIKYMHEKKFIHRDLKLGNIFLNEKFEIKIGDFGLTSQLEFLKENKRTICGTPNYIAPEILDGTGYYFEVDIWSIGIILYTLLFGFPPFESDSTPEIYSKIKRCQVYFPKSTSVPAEAISLIKSILVPKPEKRPSLDEILNSPFMRLGVGIPLELPSFCYSRAPTKIEIESMPLLSIKNNVLKERKNENNWIEGKGIKDEKSTIDKTLSRDLNSMMIKGDFEEKERSVPFSMSTSTPKTKPSNPIKNAIKNVFKMVFEEPAHKMAEYISEFEQIDEKLYYFETSQNVLGTYEKEREICFRHLSCYETNHQEIHHIRLYNNLFSEQGEIPYANYKHKVFLNLKAKNILKNRRSNIEKQEKIKEQTKEKEVYISRINVHKDMIMLRLSNKCIQIIYEHSKDGFFYEITQEKLFYFANLSAAVFQEITVTQVLSLLKNFLKNIEKFGKVPNLLASVRKENSDEHIQIQMAKIKHISEIILELKNKTIKHARARNSQ